MSQSIPSVTIPPPPLPGNPRVSFQNLSDLSHQENFSSNSRAPVFPGILSHFCTTFKISISKLANEYLQIRWENIYLVCSDVIKKFKVTVGSKKVLRVSKEYHFKYKSKLYVDTLNDSKVIATQTSEDFFRSIWWGRGGGRHVGGQLSTLQSIFSYNAIAND